MPHDFPPNRPLWCAAIAVLALVVLAPASATALSPQEPDPKTVLSLKGGPQWSLLTQPQDPEGAPTLMHGTAFDGWGFVVGPTFEFGLSDEVPLTTEIGVLYSRHRAEGFEYNPDTGARRTAVLTANVVRIPFLLSLEIPPVSGLAVGVGPELLKTVGHDATIERDGAGADGPAETLETRTTAHVGLTGRIRYDISLGESAAIPVELRGTWDPWVPETTVDRFKGYDNASSPGAYQVAFDWQVFAMTGFSWDL